MEKTLLIMAAGMGSRFGGLKQIYPVGPNGEFIIDYSIYDAIRAGFNKIVFVIKKENYDTFRETIGRRVENHIKVEYVFQEMNNIPAGFNYDENRVKPWGTAQAILAAKDIIHGPFGVINSDDFYGYDAFNVLSKFLDNNIAYNWATVGYLAKNTLSEFGPAKRGICAVKDGNLETIIESKVERVSGVIKASPLSGSAEFNISDDTMISMNMFGFSEKLFDILSKSFINFFENMKDEMTDEFLIPDVIQKCIDDKKCTVSVLKTTAKWRGMTYKEDETFVKNEILRLISTGDYPSNLWK